MLNFDSIFGMSMNDMTRLPYKEKYKAYYNSTIWRNISEHLRRGDGCCQCCGNTWYNSLKVHHMTYKNVNITDPGNERVSDVVTLCSECHSKVNDGVITFVVTPENDYDSLVKIVNSSVSYAHTSKESKIVPIKKSNTKLIQLIWDYALSQYGDGMQMDMFDLENSVLQLYQFPQKTPPVAISPINPQYQNQINMMYGYNPNIPNRQFTYPMSAQQQPTMQVYNQNN